LPGLEVDPQRSTYVVTIVTTGHLHWLEGFVAKSWALFIDWLCCVGMGCKHGSLDQRVVPSLVGACCSEVLIMQQAPRIYLTSSRPGGAVWIQIDDAPLGFLDRPSFFPFLP
jgi:hypothetical protein